MSDVEHELRELLEEKARDARTVPTVPPAVAKRGRRRQIGTVAIGATAAVLVAMASVAILRSVGPGRPTTPASNDLGERTATIQNFTVSAPAGWTLIDWGPSTATAISVTQATPEPSTTSAGAPLVYAHPSPVFELANIDPGLDEHAACSQPAVPFGSTDAVMVIERGNLVWNTGAGETPQPWPVPVDPNMKRIGPCGEGYYAAFELNGTPYFAFLRVGTSTSDADRQALFGAYAGMQAQAPAAIATTFVPPGAVGYVLAAGTEQGVPWRLELGPPIAFLTTNPNNRPTAACLRVISANDRGFGCTPFSGATAASSLGPSGQLVVDRIFLDGAVLPDATAVEYQAPGKDPVAATILEVPDSVRSSIASLSGGGDIPARLYWVLVDQDPTTVVPGPEVARIVQLAADGSQLSSQPITLVLLGSSSGAVAQSDLRNALVAAKTHYTDRATYAGFTPSVAESIEPSLTYNTSSTAVSGEISIRDVTAATVLLVTVAHDGSVWCIADDQASGTTTYGTVDAHAAAECVGGDTAWAIAPPLASPTTSPSSSLHAIETGTDLGATWTLNASLDGQQYCTQFTFGDQGVGSCSPPTSGDSTFGPDTHAPQLVTTDATAGGVFYVVSVPAEIRRVEVIGSSGTIFGAACIDPPSIAAAVRYCVVPLTGSDTGTVHFLAADGSEPLAAGGIDWRRPTTSSASAPASSSAP